MSDLIDRRSAIKAIEDMPNTYNGFSGTYDKAQIIGVLEDVPSVQPEIIRCKECDWGMTGAFSKKFFCSLTGALVWAEPDSFCSYAERRADE